MDDTGAQVIDLIFGRWRSQILYAGVKLGVFDALARAPKDAGRVAGELGGDAGLLYRLMRALGSLPGPLPPPAGHGPGAAQRPRRPRTVVGRETGRGRPVRLRARGHVP
jgi:Dimerisation domain